MLLKALRLVELIAHFAIQNFCKALIVVIGIVVTYLANWLMCVCLLHQTAIAGAHNSPKRCGACGITIDGLGVEQEDLLGPSRLGAIG